MGEFYDHPTTGKLHFTAPAGGGNSVYDGVASEADFRAHADDLDRYHENKRRAADEAKVKAALEIEQLAAKTEELKVIEALKSENAAMAEQIATIETQHSKDA